MYYVLLIHADDEAVAAAGEGEIHRLMQAVDKFDQDLTEEGRNLGSIRVRPAPEARVLSVREGRRRVMDGPFVETKEQLGGLYVIEADSMEHALETAERLPTVTFASVEVRPVLGVDLRGEVQAW